MNRIKAKQIAKSAKSTKVDKEPDLQRMYECLMRWKTENVGKVSSLLAMARKVWEFADKKSPSFDLVDWDDLNEVIDGFEECLHRLMILELKSPFDDSIVYDPSKCIGHD